jgi:hypothetical protein
MKQLGITCSQIFTADKVRVLWVVTLCSLVSTYKYPVFMSNVIMRPDYIRKMKGNLIQLRR